MKIKTASLTLASGLATIISGSLMPLQVFAQTLNDAKAAAGSGTLENLFSLVLTDINVYVVPIIFAIAFLVFLWGVFQYFIAGGADESKRSEGKNFVMWGLIGFVLMFSLWGIVNLLIGTVPGLNSQNHPTLPTFNT